MTDNDPSLLGIYLNDHLAGATAGLELFRRAAGGLAGTPAGDVVKRLAAEVEEDREALLRITGKLGFPIRQYKQAGAWAAEKVGRLKLNGRVLSRSPLSNVVELEGMKLGVLGKASGWQLLRALAATEPALDPTELDRLIERAERQARELEELRISLGTTALAKRPVAS